MNETPRKKETSNIADNELTISDSEKLSGYLVELSACISKHDIYRFRELAPALKHLLENLELTDLSKQLQQLHQKCVTAQDLVLNEIEIQELITKLTSTSTIAANTRKHGKGS